MKPELTPELKERLFAAYWGQIVLEKEFPITGKVLKTVNTRGFLDNIPSDKLLLRPLSDLTDDEKLSLCQIMDESLTESDLDSILDYWGQLVMSFEQPDYKAESHEINPFAFGLCYDYLRSIGVAVPFMGHSVDELCAAGWIKLVENKTGKE